MNSKYIITQLEQNKAVFKSILSGVPDNQKSWSPGEGSWSLLEILCHLYDEEREDFRARVRHTLESPDLPLPKIDPVGWVTSRKYREQDYDHKLQEFLKERDQSVRWLNSLKNPDWTRSHHHPKFGPMSAYFFLANWLAHDYHHIRQINRVKYEFLRETGSVELVYAGKW